MPFHLDDISDLCDRYDIRGAIGSKLMPFRSNILMRVTDRILREDSVTLKIDWMAPEGWGLEKLAQPVLSIPKDTFMQSQTVLWSSPNRLPQLGQLGWFRNVIEDDSLTNFVFDDDFLWMPVYTDLPTNRPIHHLELHAGGAGGWLFRQ